MPNMPRRSDPRKTTARRLNITEMIYRFVYKFIKQSSLNNNHHVVN